MIKLIMGFFVRLVKFSIVIGFLNILLGFIKPYLQVIIYHLIVGPKILFGAFLQPFTLTIVFKLVGLYFLWRLIKFIYKYF